MNIRLFRRAAFILIFLLMVSLSTVQAATQFIVVIDPAHGGTDNGVRISGKLHEKDVTLNIARIMKEELRKTKNVKVILTRGTDKTLSVSERNQYARFKKADLFLSLHINAGFGMNSSGYEVYFPGFKKAPSRKGGSNEIVSDMVRNEYLNESVRFAQIILKNIEKVFTRQGRGLRDAPVPVLEGMAIPAIVLEMGFATNLNDRKKMTDKKVQKKIAEVLSAGIKEYLSTLGA
jgi:N-acetylmuramoyl-L-alanine amidase